jgi:hypothetical protein
MIANFKLLTQVMAITMNSPTIRYKYLKDHHQLGEVKRLEAVTGSIHDRHPKQQQKRRCDGVLRCDHFDIDTQTMKIQNYGNPWGQFKRCQLCLTRWKLVGPEDKTREWVEWPTVGPKTPEQRRDSKLDRKEGIGPMASSSQSAKPSTAKVGQYPSSQSAKPAASESSTGLSNRAKVDPGQTMDPNLPMQVWISKRKIKSEVDTESDIDEIGMDDRMWESSEEYFNATEDQWTNLVDDQ